MICRHSSTIGKGGSKRLRRNKTYELVLGREYPRMKNELFLILVASLFGGSTSSVFVILDVIAFKPSPVVDPLTSGEVPVCGRGTTIVHNASEPEPEPEQYPHAMNISCNLEVNSSPWEI
jgi:hypothetical protein